jgi:predicted ABC-type ATPase
MSNKLIIIRGPCGVGKTTVADKLRLKLKNSILINLDYIVNKMLGLKPELKSLI